MKLFTRTKPRGRRRLGVQGTGGDYCLCAGYTYCNLHNPTIQTLAAIQRRTSGEPKVLGPRTVALAIERSMKEPPAKQEVLA